MHSNDLGIRILPFPIWEPADQEKGSPTGLPLGPLWNPPCTLWGWLFSLLPDSRGRGHHTVCWRSWAPEAAVLGFHGPVHLSLTQAGRAGYHVRSSQCSMAKPTRPKSFLLLYVPARTPTLLQEAYESPFLFWSISLPVQKGGYLAF